MQRHLLIIDDDDDDFDFIQMGSEDVPNLSCAHAKNALTGIERLRSGLYDVVLMDMNMPLISGLECLKMIMEKEAVRDIPIFIYTTEDSDARCDEARQVGAIDCLRKPYSIPALTELITQVLARSEERAMRFRLQQGRGSG